MTLPPLGVLLRTFGARGIARRTIIEIRRISNLFLAGPRHRPAPPHSRPALLYAPRGDVASIPAARAEEFRERGLKVASGNHLAYGAHWRRLPSSSEHWRADPITGFRFPMLPWWRVPDLPAGGDIKDVWEPGRFAWVYDLVRAYAVTGDDVYPRFFIKATTEWFVQNPPFVGPQWACGQETAIRAIALLHGESAFAQCNVDLSVLNDIFAASGERIDDAIAYGLSQRNNHGISEAAGLIHLGLRLGPSHRRAARWLRRGRRFLEEQVNDQFSGDGWYSQHSFFYMRTALQQVLLAQRVLESQGLTLSPTVLSRIDASARLLTLLIEGETGVVPNHGANDGGQAVPLSSSDYRDFRPLLTMVATIRRIGMPADIRPDPDVSLWLGGPVTTVAARADGVWRGDSGWAIVRRAGWSVFLRAGSYRHRPSHLDCLHIDVRYGAVEMITDPGTFAYNGQPPWRNGLAGSYVHNGPVLDGREHAEKGPRFMWRTWPRAVITAIEETDDATVLVAEIPGRARRKVSIHDSFIEVHDDTLDPAARELQVCWLLHPDAQSLASVETNGAEWIRAEEGRVDAWFSPTYGVRQRSTSLRIRRSREDGLIVRTRILRPTAARTGSARPGETSRTLSGSEH